MIFSDNAHLYYAAGLQVIPLGVNEKKPITHAWQQYSNAKISPAEQAQFIAKYPSGNMGLVLGQASGVVVVDIDLDDPEIVAEIIKALPFSPWHRKGKKGMMLAYSYTPMKTARIKQREGAMLVEFLTSRVQCVLPPSIHPDTKQPYVSNTNLYEVVDQLLPLPETAEDDIRLLLQSKGYELSTQGWTKVSNYVSSGSRDTEMTKRAGLLAYAVSRGERSLKEAIGMLEVMANDFTEKVVGDSLDVNKHVSNLVKFVLNDVRDRKKVLPIGWDKDLSEEERLQLGLDITEEERSWESSELRAWITEKGREACGNEDKEYEFLDSAVAKLARSPQLTSIQIEQLFNTICGNITMKIKPTTLKTRMREMKQGELMGQDQTEIAQHIIAKYNEVSEIRFHEGLFYEWQGSHWGVLTEDVIQTKISRDYGHLPVCKKAGDILGVIKVMAMNCAAPLAKIKLTGVNFANGFLTEDLRLIPHNLDYGCTYTMAYRYVPEEAANFPMFSAFLDQSWGREPDFKERVDTLQEMMAVTLFGEAVAHQRVFLLQGVGRSGKSQLLRIIEELLPDSAKCAIPPEDWGDKFMPMGLNNKLLNVCGELSESRSLDGKMFKEIVDGSKITSQFKFGDFVAFNPICAHWFCSNHYPKTKDTSTGFTRRWLVLTFKRIVALNETVLSLGEKIVVEEREAICAWAAQAIQRVRAKGYTLPSSHIEVMNRIANANNSLRDFLCNSRKIEIRQGAEISESELFSTYWDFCVSEGGRKPENQGRFREIMSEAGAEFDIHSELSSSTHMLQQSVKYIGVGLR